jgi:hypothetical protein
MKTKQKTLLVKSTYETDLSNLPSRLFIRKGKLQGPKGQPLRFEGMEGPVIIVPRADFEEMQEVWNWYCSRPIFPLDL